jgi:hypothetical protein
MTNTEINFDFFTIQLPNESSAVFSIFEDLADFFGTEFQSEAFDLLTGKLKTLDLKPKPNLDYESGFTQIESKNADTIFEIAKIIHSLTLSAKKRELSDGELESIYGQLKKWKKPPKQKWRIGDVFSIPLLDGSFSFGQIVGTHLTPKCPILALFEIKQKLNTITTEALIEVRVLAVWNSDDEYIANHKYKVLFNHEPITSPENVKEKKQSGGANIHNLANVFFGLEPYNVAFKEEYYDTFLQPNIERPKNIIWLNKEERNKYRLEKFKIDENNQRVT